MKLLTLILTGALYAAPDTLPPATAAAAASSGNRVVLVDPKERTKDLLQAYELLRREKPTLKINIQTTSGMLSNVVDVTAADNNTLLLVKVSFSQGTKYMVVPVEDVEEIAYSP